MMAKQRVPALLTLGTSCTDFEATDSVDDAEPRPHRPLGIVLMRSRVGCRCPARSQFPFNRRRDKASGARAPDPTGTSRLHPLRLAEDTSAPIGRITSFSAKFTDAPLAEGKFETYLPERENSKKPRAVRLSRPQLPMINCSAARRA
jgi:hypothetical protein